MGRSRHSLPFAEQISGAGSPAPLFSLSIPPLPLLFSGICVQTPGLSGEARSPLPLKHCSTVTISGHSGVGWGSMQRAETESALFGCVWGVSQENLGCLRTRLLISSQAKDSNSQVLTGRRGRQGDSVLQKRCPGLGGQSFLKESKKCCLWPTSNSLLPSSTLPPQPLSLPPALSRPLGP